MSTLLKDRYSPEFINGLSLAAERAIPSFNRRKFTRSVFSPEWEVMELKERMRHISHALHAFMPGAFDEAAPLIPGLIDQLRRNGFPDGSFECMFLPDYIESFGLDHFDSSVKLMEDVTQFTSCEFAVRPFIIRYGDRMLENMQEWTQHSSHHVRRLSSEGSRPRLPWAMAVPFLKKDPSAILPILDTLKADPSEYVRRSVANSLNDISKDHPELVLRIARKWKGSHADTNGVVRHGCRTLLKQGHPEVLGLFGLKHSEQIEFSGFRIRTPKVAVGDALSFSFQLANKGRKELPVRMEYAVYYLRQNGSHSKKVFKISERTLGGGEEWKVERNQSFRLITTRKFYTGAHFLSVVINGKEMSKGKFFLSGGL